MNHRPRCAFVVGLILVAVMPLSLSFGARADEYTPFDGRKSSWHDGFDRYDYLMDEESLDIQPFERDAGEKFGIKDPPRGKRRCVVIVPRTPAPGNPWSCAAATGTISRKPRSSCSSVASTSLIFRPTRP